MTDCELRKREYELKKCERFKELVRCVMEEEGIRSQSEFARVVNDRCGNNVPLLRQQYISRIANGKNKLPGYLAKSVIKAFPKYRIEWLLGIDDYMTEDEFLCAVANGNLDLRRWKSRAIAVAHALGYSVSIDQCGEMPIVFAMSGEAKAISPRGVVFIEQEIGEMFDKLLDLAYRYESR